MNREAFLESLTLQLSLERQVKIGQRKRRKGVSRGEQGILKGSDARERVECLRKVNISRNKRSTCVFLDKITFTRGPPRENALKPVDVLVSQQHNDMYY